MSILAGILIGISVFMHVGWNALSKATKPSMSFYLLMNGLGGIIWLPFFIISRGDFWGLPFKFYLFILISWFFQVLYMYGLANGYKRSDISLVYPLIRAFPVVLLAIITGIFHIGKPLTFYPFTGMVLISLGCIIMSLPPLHNFSIKGFNRQSLCFIAVGAIGTVGYTLVDSQSVAILAATDRNSISTILGFLFLIQLGLTIGEIPFILWSREEKKIFRSLSGRKIWVPALAGIFSTGAYGLVLFAMKYVTNVSYVQAFRQLSLPLGFIVGITFLHEKNTLTKSLGMFLIFFGLIIVSVL